MTPKPNIYLENFSAAMEDQRRELTPEQDALEHIAACRDKHFLEERHIDAIKGRMNFIPFLKGFLEEHDHMLRKLLCRCE